MKSSKVTGREISFGEEEIIVSKTNLKGVITYSNDVFQRVAGYEEDELLGQPHNLLRHSSMPRCVFKLLWNRIESNREVFAYILNRAKNGDGYWVFAHVTPSYDSSGIKVGYHSNRRWPYPDALEKVRSLYASLLSIESRHSSAKEGMEASTQALFDVIHEHHVDYDDFVFSLSSKTKLENSVN